MFSKKLKVSQQDDKILVLSRSITTLVWGSLFEIAFAVVFIQIWLNNSGTEPNSLMMAVPYIVGVGVLWNVSANIIKVYKRDEFTIDKEYQLVLNKDKIIAEFKDIEHVSIKEIHDSEDGSTYNVALVGEIDIPIEQDLEKKEASYIAEMLSNYLKVEIKKFNEK